jgi:alpha-glucosidase
MAVQPRARTIVLTLCSALLATATAALPARAEAPAAPKSWEVRGPHGSPRRWWLSTTAGRHSP